MLLYTPIMNDIFAKGYWAISKEAHSALMAKGIRDTQETRAQIIKSKSELIDNMLQSNTDGSASISIKGYLLKQRFWASLLRAFGMEATSYEDILDSLHEASDYSVINLYIDSPGGEVKGLMRVLDTIYSMRANGVTFNAHIDDALSAAYCIASQSSTILATDKMSRAAGIGVIATYYRGDNASDMVTYTDSNSEQKAPAPGSNQGDIQIRRHLGEVEEVLRAAIARGRGVKPAYITENYGRGEIFVALSAFNKKIIDGIESVEINFMDHKEENMINSHVNDVSKQQSQPAAGGTGESTYAHNEAIQQARQEGINTERSRVNAILAPAASSESLKIAIEAIKAGTSYDVALPQIVGAEAKATVAQIKQERKNEEESGNAPDIVNVDDTKQASAASEDVKVVNEAFTDAIQDAKAKNKLRGLS